MCNWNDFRNKGRGWCRYFQFTGPFRCNIITYMYVITSNQFQSQNSVIPVRILYKSTAGRYRPVRVADGPITARYRFIKNAIWDVHGNIRLAPVFSQWRLEPV